MKYRARVLPAFTCLGRASYKFVVERKLWFFGRSDVHKSHTYYFSRSEAELDAQRVLAGYLDQGKSGPSAVVAAPHRPE